MKIPVLVIDASVEFGMLIQSTLEESGSYQVTFATTGAEAVEILTGSDIQLAIVDFGLPDLPGPNIVDHLRSSHPDLKIIAIPMSNMADDPEVERLDLDGVLTKPFYLPDLQAIVAQALDLDPEELEAEPAATLSPVGDEPEQESSGPPPPWLEDVDRAAQYLTRLNLESSAEAALLTRGRRLWAYAGQLAQSQVQELTGLIADHWASEGRRGALAKYIRLAGSTDDLMLYATALRGDIILSLVFSAEIPFGMIREEGENLAHTLAEVDPSQLQPEMEPPEAEEDEAENEPYTDFDVPGGEKHSIPSDWIPERQLEPEDIPFLADLADLDLPSPDPEPVEAARLEEQADFQTELDVEPLPIPDDWVPSSARPPEHLPFLEEYSLDENEGGSGPSINEDTRPVRVALPETHTFLPYTAVLLPRLPEHRLDGDLKTSLYSWTQQICIAFDWRADAINIQPEYLSISLSLRPEVAPASAIKSLRENLASRVLETFPHLLKDLPSGYFFARGYLLNAGDHPAPDQINEFVAEIRRSQGIQS